MEELNEEVMYGVTEEEVGEEEMEVKVMKEVMEEVGGEVRRSCWC